MGERRPGWSLGSLSGRATVFPSIWRQAALTLPHQLDRAIIFGDGHQAEDRANILKREHFVGRLRPAGCRTVLRESLAESRQAWGRARQAAPGNPRLFSIFDLDYLARPSRSEESTTELQTLM